MDQIMLPTPEMALEFAKILATETFPPDVFERLAPLHVEDRDDMWFATGNGDDGRNQPHTSTGFHLKDETFYMHVFKKDSEVVNFGINAHIAVPPNMQSLYDEKMRAEMRSYRGDLSELRRDRFSKDARDLQYSELLYGGIINSNKAANRFGALIFRNHFASMNPQILEPRTELVDGIWHVYANAEQQRAELVFRRYNAQVLSLDLRPIE